MKTKNPFVITVFSLCLSFVCLTQAEEVISTSSGEQQPATPAPLNWKASVSSYFYDFEGTKASTSENAQYNFANSTLNLQLLTLQYQVDPGLSILVIGQHLKNYVETNMLGNKYEDKTEGFGDTQLLAIKTVYATESAMVIVDGGVSVPTGSVNLNNKYNPSGHYAPNMQLGSGTLDLIVGVTPLWLTPTYQLGSRLSTAFRTGKNSSNYTLGNLYKLDAWADYPLAYGFTPRLVGYYKYKDAIRGEDPNYTRQDFTEFYYHAQINWDISAALKYQYAINSRLAAGGELGLPVAQNSANYDSVVVSTQYYGNLFLNGSF